MRNYVNFSVTTNILTYHWNFDYSKFNVYFSVKYFIFSQAHVRLIRTEKIKYHKEEENIRHW